MKLHFIDLNFPAAHYIPGQGGKCEGVHGHNYFIRDLVVNVVSSKLSDEQLLGRTGMIIDFGLIKDYFKREWDHKLIVPTNDAQDWAIFLDKIGRRQNLKVVDLTTAEGMALDIKRDLINMIHSCVFDRLSNEGVRPSDIDVRVDVSLFMPSDLDKEALNKTFKKCFKWCDKKLDEVLE